ncbi:hypothetical protein JJB11_16385 [Ramlibacter ginsenosidimutans]|uniref:Uncharacterized protein n=1 Tax=Ramlibacter ginsenosidimutans TaxID=502333 RepID=A0A934TU91_9BURK|nr:hypothetical protein [Ramlibacter ginsenosidimutans]MBK6007679.1 hypothetical protein [Ramlibacter ginsenosidimutans]
MPNAKDNAKASGDVHLPEIEDEVGSPAGKPVAEGAEGGPPDAEFSRDVHGQGRVGKRVEEAGILKDKDAPGLGSDKP